MKTRFLLIFLLSIFWGHIAVGQNVEFKKENFPEEQHDRLKEIIKELRLGDELFDIGQRAAYLQALDHYLTANDFNPMNALLNYKIGKCYLNSLEKSKAIYHLEKAVRLDVNVAPDLQYLLAQSYHFNLEIDKAISKYRLYMSTLQKDELETTGKEVNKKLDECKVAKEMIANPKRVYIDNLGEAINTRFPEFAPLINADETQLMFTSSRDNTTGGGIDPEDFFYYEDIYTADHANGVWLEAKNSGPPLNTVFHDATVWLSPDGQRLIIYRGDNGGDLYESRLKGNKWSNPERFPRPINSKYHEQSASFSPDFQTLYFVSNRPGGQGLHDIYSCKRDRKGNWEAPVNLGPTINTPYDEAGVFMHPDGKTLYFSSQGHYSMGGFDLFKSVYEDGQWSEPENLGYPINSADDDVFMSISGSGLHGYYASYRPEGFGEKDIYMITFLGPDKPTVDANDDNLLASLIEPFKATGVAPAVEVGTSQLTILKGVIRDEITEEPLGATIELTDLTNNVLVGEYESNSTTGKYLVTLPSGINYGITARAPDYLFHSENLNIPKSKGYQEITKDIDLQKIEVGKKIVLRNIFFDFDRYTLRPESRNELERLIALMNEYKTLKIEISGHTDSKGSAAYNQKLSGNRAKTVVDYLIKAGIDQSRLVYAGYGFTQPIATNKTDEGRQLNRRTEFKILAK